MRNPVSFRNRIRCLNQPCSLLIEKHTPIITTVIGIVIIHPDSYHTATPNERIPFNSGDTVRNRHAGQAGAIAECIFTNTGNAVRYIHTCQAGAISEHIFPNAGDAIWDIHACQAATKIEYSITNAGNGVGDNQTGQAVAFSECATTYTGNTVRDGNFDQAATCIKRTTANTGNAVGDEHIGQATAKRECRTTNRSNFCTLIISRNYNIGIGAGTDSYNSPCSILILGVLKSYGVDKLFRLAWFIRINRIILTGSRYANISIVASRLGKLTATNGRLFLTRSKRETENQCYK